MANPKKTQRPIGDWRFSLFNLFWISSSILLVLGTWRLWVGTDKFPQIPLLSIFIETPVWIDHVALAICGAASLLMIGSLFGGRTSNTQTLITPKLRLACLIWAAAVAILFATNQHRLQPWAWQAFVFAMLIVLSATKPFFLTASRIVIVSIYLWSAISKFDYQFLHGLGRQFAAAITELTGSPIQPNEISPWIVGLLPAGELLVGILLIFPVTARIGVVAAFGFHLSLIMILGPWAMDHHVGVVIWNFFFALFTAVLFWPEREQADSATEKTFGESKLVHNGAAIVLTALVTAMPIYSHWDHWLAWGLYSPNNRRCTIKVVATAEQEFDESLKPFLRSVKDEWIGGLEFLEVDLGAMSLELLNAPIYPEARMQWGVCDWINSRYLRGLAMVTIQSKSDRWTGKRKSTPIEPTEPKEQGTAFFFNHLPRTAGNQRSR